MCFLLWPQQNSSLPTASQARVQKERNDFEDELLETSWWGKFVKKFPRRAKCPGSLKGKSWPARWGLLDFMSDARLLLLPPSPPPSSPDLICQLLIAVGLAGPPLPALDCCGPRRTSTASSHSLWASPDFNQRESERCGPRRTSTGPQRP